MAVLIGFMIGIGIIIMFSGGVFFEKHKSLGTIIIIVGTFLICSGIYMFGTEMYKIAQIDALQDNWKYEKQYVYSDSVSVDIVYIKKHQ